MITELKRMTIFGLEITCNWSDMCIWDHGRILVFVLSGFMGLQSIMARHKYMEKQIAKSTGTMR